MRIPLFDGSAIAPAWHEMEDETAIRSRQLVRQKNARLKETRKKEGRARDPRKARDGFYEQCFRCDLPDCYDTSRECLVYKETGRFVSGRERCRSFAPDVFAVS